MPGDRGPAGVEDGQRPTQGRSMWTLRLPSCCGGFGSRWRTHRVGAWPQEAARAAAPAKRQPAAPPVIQVQEAG